MRLRSVILHGFKCFPYAEFDLSSSTVLVGANNAGKSTVLDAVRSLYDRQWPPSPPFTRTLMLKSELPDVPYLNLGTDVPFDGVSFVIGEFDNLTDREARAWAPIQTDGVVRFGRFWEVSDDGPFDPDQLGIVLNAPALARLVDAAGDGGGAEFVERVQAFEGTYREAASKLGAAHFGGYFWMGPYRGHQPWFPDAPIPLQLGTWPDPPRPSDMPDRDRLVLVEGPDAAPPDFSSVLRPIVAATVSHGSAAIPTEVMEALRRSTRAAGEVLSAAYARAAHTYLPDVYSARLEFEPFSAETLTDALVRGVTVQLARGSSEAAPHRWTDLSSLGAGARRGAALAALDLYRDPDLWPPDQSVMLLIEEPETGLHPQAQRRLAAALRELPTYGVQSLLVTHSPIFVNAADPSGLRLVQTETISGDDGSAAWRHYVRAPEQVREAADELGALPADVLLAHSFVVVEGQSDAAVLSMWARSLGAPFERAGVRLVPAGGQGVAGRVAQFLRLAYEGAEFWVVLDNGPDTAKTKMVIEAEHGGRVQVRLLARTEIEAYYSPEAVVGWLQHSGASTAEDVVLAAVEPRPSKKVLRQLAEKYLHRAFDVVLDGLAIASLMPERQIAAEIASLIYDLVEE